MLSRPEQDVNFKWVSVTTAFCFDELAAEQTRSNQKSSKDTDKTEEYLQFSREERIICMEMVIVEH